MQDRLTWDDSYAIAISLIKAHPERSIDELSLSEIYNWTLQLPDFQDDPRLSNDAILMAIFREWFEEVTNK